MEKAIFEQTKHMPQSIDVKPLPATPRKETYFCRGAGMEGAYGEDFAQKFREAGLEHAYVVDPDDWSTNGLWDAFSVLWERDLDKDATDMTRFGDQGEQFNLVGYSYGGTQAANTAADYADRGGTVDNLVLVGTPISREFLEKWENHPNIGKVIIEDLPGNPIYAGMGFWETARAGATLQSQNDGDNGLLGEGHYFYSGDDAISEERRKEFVGRLVKTFRENDN
ncbi:MAG: alpha/beta hydrolase [Alphaproteobacteria bacterium]|nr:alpha/beta hydrolase [Alphaproteobacteria bacterium]